MSRIFYFTSKNPLTALRGFIRNRIGKLSTAAELRHWLPPARRRLSITLICIWLTREGGGGEHKHKSNNKNNIKTKKRYLQTFMADTELIKLFFLPNTMRTVLINNNTQKIIYSTYQYILILSLNFACMPFLL